MSVVQICNRGASQYLGLPRVNNLNEGTPQSEQYELHYDDLRRSLLEKHWWTFATRRQALAPMVNDREDEWLYRYELPAKIIEIQWINAPDVAAAAKIAGRSPDTPRDAAEQSIYCNVELAYIEYTTDYENTETMPQYFKDALSAMIAAAVAMPLTESVQRARFAAEQSEIMINMAIAEDEANQPGIDLPQSNYIDARTAGPFGYRTLDHLE